MLENQEWFYPQRRQIEQLINRIPSLFKQALRA